MAAPPQLPAPQQEPAVPITNQAAAMNLQLPAISAQTDEIAGSASFLQSNPDPPLEAPHTEQNSGSDSTMQNSIVSPSIDIASSIEIVGRPKKKDLRTFFFPIASQAFHEQIAIAARNDNITRASGEERKKELEAQATLLADERRKAQNLYHQKAVRDRKKKSEIEMSLRDDVTVESSRQVKKQMFIDASNPPPVLSKRANGLDSTADTTVGKRRKYMNWFNPILWPVIRYVRNSTYDHQ
ncbi:uncharacterized protein H6S33_011826 [Morchella sextelata]|uniref:uncharacterized protein n=1 Tax=Morchella sextelata TaxID=1174677 RepID=UPI001D051EE6|nr:uncharacterized protein H6S33_011826 [Morchella sextelata]KAH0610299.1 hypothetical protein H6S33_011826 [Morchella sextelata]